MVLCNQKYSLRHASTETNISTTITEKIPEPPVIPDLPPVPKIVEDPVVLPEGAEVPFESIGLGGWSPVGMVQNCMEFLHISCDIPWWGTILIGTVVVRACLLPLVIIAQRNAANVANNVPQMQLIQEKLTEARQSGNQLEAARYSNALMEFMREKKINPLKNMLVPLVQAPIFISFFIGLRQMANTPVESMRDGGLFWFTDLTVSDPYYLLPIITSITMLATIELGTDSAKMQHQNMAILRYVFRALPFVIFPFTMSFPGGIVFYWTSSNIISLGQVALLRLPKVREYFNIPKILPQPAAFKPKKKGFGKTVKESWTNMKITRELEDRRRVDEMMFQRAAKGAIQKTYKNDPTKAKVATSMSAISAKKR